MKILIVHPRVDIYGGAEVVIAKLSQYLLKQGHNVGFLSSGCTKELREQLKGVTIYLANHYRHSKLGDLLNLCDSVPMFGRDYDLINYHNFPAPLAHSFINKPSVWLCNEPPELFTTWWRKPIEGYNRWLVNSKIKNVVVADEYNSKRFESLYLLKPKIIPYGIDYELFSSHNHSETNGEFIVTQVGTMTYYKNQLATIEAVGKLQKQIPNIRLILIGKVCEPDYKDKVDESIRQNNLGGKVSWEGHITQNHLAYLYSATDVLIHPVKEQGGWLTPFEAISANVPVVVSKELTCSRMVKDNDLGVVTDDYASAIYDIYSNYDNYCVKTYKAKEWVRNNLTWDKFGERMLKYFERVIDG